MNFGYMNGHSSHLPWLNYRCKIECLQPQFFLVSHNTTKAWENAYVVGFGPYMWNGREQRKRKRWLKDHILGPWQRRGCLGREVRYALVMILKHSQKGRQWLSKVNNYEDTPYWLNACWTTSETCVSFTVLLMSLLMSRACFPSSGKVTYPTAQVPRWRNLYPLVSR